MRAQYFRLRRLNKSDPKRGSSFSTEARVCFVFDVFERQSDLVYVNVFTRQSNLTTICLRYKI